MVDEGKSNEAIYSYVQKNYGNKQVAVPRQGWFNRISYGLPFLLMGFFSIIALGFAWNWTDSDDDDSDNSESQTDMTGKQEKIEELASEQSPLH